MLTRDLLGFSCQNLQRTTLSILSPVPACTLLSQSVNGMFYLHAYTFRFLSPVLRSTSGFNCLLFVLQYADPVSDMLDTWGAFRNRLFRESCVFHKGNYVKDLSRLGRDLDKVIIIDNSPVSYIFHPENAVSLHPFCWIQHLCYYFVFNNFSLYNMIQ